MIKTLATTHRFNSVGCIQLSVDKVKSYLEDEKNYYLSTYDASQEKQLLDELKSEMADSIKSKSKMAAKRVVEQCFQWKKVNIIDSALLEYKTKFTQDVDETNSFKWLSTMLTALIKMQLYGNGDNSVLSDLLRDFNNKQDLF